MEGMTFNEFYTKFEHHTIPLNATQALMIFDLKDKLPRHYQRDIYA